MEMGRVITEPKDFIESKERARVSVYILKEAFLQVTVVGTNV